MKGLARLARSGLAAAAHYSGALAAYRRLRLRDRGIILMYHRVAASEAEAANLDPGMYVMQRSLESQLRDLLHSHTLVTIDQFGEWMAGTAQFPKPPCALTFDDGWLDNYETAFPVLRRYSAPATIFLITGDVGKPRMMGWDQILEMERHGIAFGSHTVTHAQLGQCDPARIRTELAESRATLQQRLARPSRWFCFPKGSHNDTACALVSEYYDGALVTTRGWVSRSDDRFRVRRIAMHEDVSRTPPLFAWRLALLR